MEVLLLLLLHLQDRQDQRHPSNSKAKLLLLRQALLLGASRLLRRHGTLSLRNPQLLLLSSRQTPPMHLPASQQHLSKQASHSLPGTDGASHLSRFSLSSLPSPSPSPSNSRLLKPTALLPSLKLSLLLLLSLLKRPLKLLLLLLQRSLLLLAERCRGPRLPSESSPILSSMFCVLICICLQTPRAS